MNFYVGSQRFFNVKIPILWGERAILSHSNQSLSIIYIGGEIAKPEIVSDTPWNEIEYSEKEDGFVIYQNGLQSYFYSPKRKLLRDLTGALPECEMTKEFTRIGSNRIVNGMIEGSDVGIGVSANGFFIGGPIPPGLAELKF